MKKLLALAIASALPLLAHAAVDVDGLANESEWQAATELTDLRLTEPNSGAVPGFKTRVRFVSLPEGVAFFFENEQDPKTQPKRAARQVRDNAGGSDRVNVMIDFDGNGQAGYNFTVTRSDSIEDATISNENNFNADWDGLWYHAVSETETGWNAEILVPWSTGLMREVDGADRTIGLYVDRVLGADSSRAAQPPVLFFRPVFLSEFEKHTIPSFKQGLLRFYPYATVLRDFVGDQTEFRSGGDLFWKPSANFQLTATINPDFGQVEADDLVVNFEAVEAFFSDRRPFFTENQAVFVRRSPEEEQLIYTRRIGGSRDDGQGVSDIDLATKVSGSSMGFDFGVFAVRERDPDVVGRSVGALRVNRPGEHFDFGYLGSYVERPFLDRIATVHALDKRWQSGPWQWSTTLMQSDIRSGANTTRGTGGFSTVSYKPNNHFEFRGDITRYGSEFDFNDLGFQRRKNFTFYELAPSWQQPSYPDGHWLRSSEFSVDLNVAENSAGKNLYEEYELGTELNFSSGSNSYLEFRYRPAGIDDLVSRGNGSLDLRSGKTYFANYEAVRSGNFQNYAEIYLDRTALRGKQTFVSLSSRYFVNDDLNVELGLGRSSFRGRTLWQNGTLFGVFDRSRGLEPSLQVEWFSGSRHELRIKSQWLIIEGTNAQAFRLQPNRQLLASTEQIDDFSISNFGFQMRYRFKLNPESDIYVVYSRGGEQVEEPGERGLGDLFEDSLELRDADQFLVKIRYAL